MRISQNLQLGVLAAIVTVGCLAVVNYANASPESAAEPMYPTMPRSLAPDPSAETADDPVTRKLRALANHLPVPSARPTPAPGIYQTEFGKRITYLTADGRYAFVGDMIDLETRVNLTQKENERKTRVAMAELEDADMVIYPAQGERQASVTVFTDASCSYCRKLHRDVPALTQAGIEVRYVPFPRSGLQSESADTLRKVWCSPDRQSAMNTAKGRGASALGEDFSCPAANAVSDGYQLGLDLGVNGTPMLFADTGQKINGYVSSSRLLSVLLP